MKLLIILLLLNNNSTTIAENTTVLQKDKEAIELELKKESIYRQINLQHN